MTATDHSSECRLVVIGQGYVGLPLAMLAVQAGYSVIGLDSDPTKVEALNAGRSYIEDVRDAELRQALKFGAYRATTDPADLEGFDVAVIAVPTPLTEDHLPDVSCIEKAAGELAPHVSAGAIVILESTTYPGTTQEVLRPALERGSGLKAGRDFHLGFSPERIDPGNPTWNLANTPKIVSGTTEQACALIANFYRDLGITTHPVSRPEAAEMAKIVENTFRYVNIALVNELAQAAGAFGLDINEVLEAADTKPYGFMRFFPGPGVGGHCIPIDPLYLTWAARRRFVELPLVELADELNVSQPQRVCEAVADLVDGALEGKRILLLGLAYKADSGDCRESPALVIADTLLACGAQVAAVDPFVQRWPDERIERLDLTKLALKAADVVVVTTLHSSFDFERVVRDARCVLDPYARLAGRRVRHL